jgi:hypothetical protein
LSLAFFQVPRLAQPSFFLRSHFLSKSLCSPRSQCSAANGLFLEPICIDVSATRSESVHGPFPSWLFFHCIYPT